MTFTLESLLLSVPHAPIHLPVAADAMHLTRAAAVSSYVALAFTVSLGVLRGIVCKVRGQGSWVLDEVHQLVALLAAALIALHLVALALAPHLSFPLIALIEPVGDPQRPLAHALGALALYALVIVMLSTWLRRLLPYKLWRALHVLSFLLFCCATLHGLLASVDAALPWMRVLYTAGVSAVALLLCVRVCVPARATTARSHPKATTPASPGIKSDIP